MKFDDIRLLPNGAQFLRADLHVHSTYSHDVKDSSMTPESLVNAGVKMDLAFLSVTDHNCIDGSLDAIAYAERIGIRSLLVIPAIELTTPNGHVLAYFPNITSLKTFFGGLDIVNDAQDSRTTNSMVDVIAMAQARGGVCVAAHIDTAKGFEAANTGYPAWKSDVICHPGLVGLEFRKPENSTWYSLNDEQNRLAIYRKRVERHNRSGGAFARFQNSDAHNMGEFIAGKDLSRIKVTSRSFAAFTTAMADPEARVRMNEGLPSSLPQLVGIEIVGGFLGGFSAHFSSNLNVLFGGRGSGKTSVLRAIAFCLDRDLGSSVPFETARLFCKDADGTKYKFERRAGTNVIGHLFDPAEKTLSDATPDYFPIEYISQGELSNVARECLSSPAALQNFLDRHMNLVSLHSEEDHNARRAGVIAAQLAPLIAIFTSLDTLKLELDNVQAKLKVREEGQLSSIAADQNELNAEQSYAAALLRVRQQYLKGVSFSNLIRSPVSMRAMSQIQKHSTDEVAKLFTDAEQVVEGANAYLRNMTREIGTTLTEYAARINSLIVPLPRLHETVQVNIDSAVDALVKNDLQAALKEFDELSKHRTELIKRVDQVETQRVTYEKTLEEFEECLTALESIRLQITKRRADQMTEISKSLKPTFEQYTIILFPDKRGVCAAFESFIEEVMQGTYFPSDARRKVALATSPQILAGLVSGKDEAGLRLIDGIGTWASQFVERFSSPTHLLKLRILWKPPSPRFKVMQLGNAGEVPFDTLSDGQKSTVLLTVALLSESRAPLVMDQPEDDLDNQFIFKTVVATLRAVKERRQVILVTHNANIAVLSDSELLIGMTQRNGKGEKSTSGSIDDPTTMDAIKTCLEGGAEAFRRRASIFGWDVSQAP